MFWGSVIIDNYGLQLVSMVYNDYQFFYRHYKFNERTEGDISDKIYSQPPEHETDEKYM